MSSWLQAPDAGTAPTTAAGCGRATVGSLLASENVSSLTAQYWQVAATFAATPSTVLTLGQGIILADRVSHQGGLSGIVTTAQTTNLPTGALTRFTSGVGVCIALEIYTAIGATATTVTVSYTNQAGTAGRTSQASVFGGSLSNAVARFVILPLQDGDTGVRSVESVTVLATTGTAGAFGVTLFKPLCPLRFSWGGQTAEQDALLDWAARFTEHHNDACPMLINMGGNAGSLTPVLGHLQLAEA